MPKSPNYPSNRTIGEVIASMRKPAPGADTAWYRIGPSEPHGINFTNSATSWVNSSLAVPVSWYLGEDGEVKIRGTVHASHGVMFRLPPEARPEFSQTFICATETGDTDDEATIHLNIKFRAFEEEPDAVEDP